LLLVLDLNPLSPLTDSILMPPPSLSLKKVGTVATTIATAYDGTLIMHEPFVFTSNYGGDSRLEALRKNVHNPNAVMLARKAQQLALAISKSNLLNVLVIDSDVISSSVTLDVVSHPWVLSCACVISIFGSLFCIPVD